MNKFTKQCVAAFASLAMAGTLCVAGAVVANNVAFATGPTAAEKAPWDLGNEATTKKGSITIHKQDDTTKAGVPGAVFSAKKVKTIDGTAINLTSRDDWETLAQKVDKLNKSATVADNTIAYETPLPDQTTNSKGEAKFADLSIGIYRIEEKNPPKGYTSDVIPFFMTVPEITRDKSSTNNKYTYDVSVTPKNHNVKDAISKAADTKNMVGVGDVLPYTINATPNKTKATNLDKDGKAKNLTKEDLSQYAIFDDALTTAYENANENAVAEVKLDGETDALIKGTDYEVTKAATPDDNTRTRISVVFKDAGLEKIITKLNAVTNAQQQPQIHVTFNFKIASTVTTGSDHKLSNKYGFIPGGKTGENHEPVVPDTTTDTEFRKFHILKYDAKKGETTKLDAAKFKVFAGANGDPATDSNALKVAQKCADDPTNADNCKTSLSGFGEKSTKNGVTEDYSAKVGQKFYIVETSAPENFTRSTKVYEVTLTSAPSKDGAQVVKIANVPTKDGDHNWFNLPKTGAAGVIIFALAGMCLVAVGMFIFLRNRKKDEEQQAA